MKEDPSDIASRLQSIIDTAIDGIIVINAEGIVEEINRSALDLFEYSKEELIGKNIRMLMQSPDRENHDQYIRRYRKTRNPRIIGIGREVEGLKKSGVVFPFRLAVSEVKLKDRVVYTGIVHDLTQVKAAQKAKNELLHELENRVVARTEELEQVVNRLIRANKKLESEVVERKKAQALLIEKEKQLTVSLKKEKELNELKSRFLSMASHEFRTPLSTILSSVALIDRYQSTDDIEKRSKHINRIKSAVENLIAILNDFLSLDKLDTDINMSQSEEIEIQSVCAEAISDVSGLLPSHQSIILESNGHAFIIQSDKRIIKNILFNLFVNSIKYTPEGTDILCRIDFDDTQVNISVIDRGIGVPENEQKHILDRFFRASNVDTIAGTGLGLSIVTKYLEIIRGSLSFESREGMGSTFKITLPKTK